MEYEFYQFVDKTVIANDRRKRIHPWQGITIHHTGSGTLKKTNESQWARWHRILVGYLTKKDNTYVSSHFQIARDGEAVMMVDPRVDIAYHAGKSSFWNPLKRKVTTSWNYWAISIELVGDGNVHEYTNDQIEKCALISAALLLDFPTINPLCVVGHEVISPGRKVDPGKYFPWRGFYGAMGEYVKWLKQMRGNR